MSGALCLQGGNEFTTDCREMDTEVLERAGDGPVAVIAGAARVGSDYDGASSRARRHYEGLGADVVVVPDPRIDLAAAVAGLTDDVALVVLPGGSPASLREVLSGDVEDRLRELYDNGTAISGASAGAMVLCERMVRPGGSNGGDVVDGLGLASGLALPHWSPGSDRTWPIPDDLDLWGLPECGGVVIDGGANPVAVGHGEPSCRFRGVWKQLPRA
ncbi:MAG: Type 1 glutamine amidotransferase-like domain-containing protein [Ilumatobacter sp.]|uniref:Type 1 glutamine amidotransferase-like domain-containing protein n=1 Tax=Ilumatobacter sp. TaxID=1967498 RepID=UPI003C73C7F8